MNTREVIDQEWAEFQRVIDQEWAEYQQANQLANHAYLARLELVARSDRWWATQRRLHPEKFRR